MFFFLFLNVISILLEIGRLVFIVEEQHDGHLFKVELSAGAGKSMGCDSSELVLGLHSIWRTRCPFQDRASLSTSLDYVLVLSTPHQAQRDTGIRIAIYW